MNPGIEQKTLSQESPQTWGFPAGVTKTWARVWRVLALRKGLSLHLYTNSMSPAWADLDSVTHGCKKYNGFLQEFKPLIFSCISIIPSRSHSYSPKNPFPSQKTRTPKFFSADARYLCSLLFLNPLQNTSVRTRPWLFVSFFIGDGYFKVSVLIGGGGLCRDVWVAGFWDSGFGAELAERWERGGL